MQQSLVQRILIILALLAASLVSPGARACSVCGCDPTGGTLGLDRPNQSDLRVILENRYLQKESGTEQASEGEREDRFDLRFQYSPPIADLSFQVEVPVYAWKTHLGSTSAIDDTSRGLSDAAVGARYEVLKLGGLVPRHVLSVTFSLKLPTGDNTHRATVDQGSYDEHKQVGTGTFDELFGAWYTFGDFPTIVYAGVTARINGTNSRGNHYGNALFGTLGVRRSFLEDKHLFFALDAQVRNAGKDTTPGGAYDGDSGGAIGYATGSAGYAITNDLLVRAIIQVPVVKALNGAQGEHPVGFLSFAYDFTL